MKSVLLFIIILACSVLTQSSRASDLTPSQIRNREQHFADLERMDNWIIPSLILKDATVDEALATIARLSSSSSPDKKGISFIISKGGDLDGVPKILKKITLSEKNISVLEAVRKVAKVNDWVFCVEGNTIRLWDHSPCYEPLPTSKTFKIDPARVPAGLVSNPQKFLEDCGAGFSSWCSAEYREQDHLLVIRNTENQIDFIKALIQNFYKRNKAGQTPR